MSLSNDLAKYEPMFVLDREGYAALLATSSSDRASTIMAGQTPIVSVEGRKLHSGRDPIKEARRFARRHDVLNKDIIVLLGYASGHVARAIKQRARGQIVVFEPDLEALRIGLQHGEPDPDILLITDPDRLGSRLSDLVSSGQKGSIITWFPSLRQQPEIYEHALTTVNSAIRRAQCREVTTSCRIDGWLDFYLQNLPQLLSGPNLADLSQCLKGIPAIVCSAGPSLSKNAALLRELRDSTFILCVNTAAPALAKCGVQPHAVISVESLDISSQLRDIDWIESTPIFLELTGNPKHFDLPCSQKIPISVETSSAANFSEKIDPKLAFKGGLCVANAAVAVLFCLGCSDIILIGQDLAYTDDRVYAEGTNFEDIRVKFEDGKSHHIQIDSKREILASSDGSFLAGFTPSESADLVTVNAWGDPNRIIRSNSEFQHFREWFESVAPVLNRNGISTINATEGGGHLKNWEEISLQAAIERLDLRRPIEAEQSVSLRFQKALKQPGVDPQRLIDLVEKERQRGVDILTIALQSRALVDDNPEGDIAATGPVAERLALLSSQLFELLSQSTLIRDSVAHPIMQLQLRQEFNLYSLASAIETRLTLLDQRLGELIDRLKESSVQKPAA